MKEAALVIIKPDGVSKSLMGYLLTRLAETKLQLAAVKLVKVDRALAEEHYKPHRKKFFFEEIIRYLCGRLHRGSSSLALVYYGTNAIQRCRDLAGATNPEAADPGSIRGSCGRITTKGIYENLLHVSSNRKEAEREIKLWFKPEDLTRRLFRTKIIMAMKEKKQVWA